MQNKNFRFKWLSLAVSFVMTGCAPAGVLVGGDYGNPPPQIVFLGAVDGKGNEYLTWDRPRAFGPVPQEMKASGDIGCMSLGLTLRATGYHPKALDRRGNEISGGGFFCQIQPFSEIDNSPPRVVEIEGKLGWDRPSAFRAIPAEKLTAAQDECRKKNPKSRPLGYHPEPLGQDGNPMQEGGFLCIE